MPTAQPRGSSRRRRCGCASGRAVESALLRALLRSLGLGGGLARARLGRLAIGGLGSLPGGAAALTRRAGKVFGVLFHSRSEAPLLVGQLAPPRLLDEGDQLAQVVVGHESPL